MTKPERPRLDFEPPWPALAAGLIFLVAGLTLCWPIFTGQFLAGPESDQFIAGYSFRHFAAEYHRQFGSVPQWNPYLFGGMPFVGAAHGDIFYPTAWLRWFLPTDVAMSLGFAVHIVLAGCFMYGLLRTLGLSWAGAVVGGLAYEMTGIVISLVHPGHDGKLFVSAAAPLLFSGIVWAVRDRRTIGYAVVALATGLALQGHPQTTQYLLVAGALWGAFWLFGAEGPKGTSDKVRVMAGSVGALALGIGLYAIYALPMAAYVPFSPRAAGGANTGWEHAIQFSLPASELVGVLLPKIYGGMTNYFGPNGLRLHSEYLGPVILLLAAMGLGGPDRRTARRAFVAIGVVFLLVSLGGSTPFFRIWYAIIPLTSRLRAPGQAFFLVAMALAFFAAIGAERLLRGAASKRRIAGATIALGVFGLLAAAGLLQLVSEDMARSPGYQGFIEAAIANASALQADGGRLLLVTAIVGALALALIRFRLPSWAGLGLLLVATWIDPWVIGREYFVFSPPARVTYAADPVIQRIQATKLPYRVFGPEGDTPGSIPTADPGSCRLGFQPCSGITATSSEPGTISSAARMVGRISSIPTSGNSSRSGSSSSPNPKTCPDSARSSGPRRPSSERRTFTRPTPSRRMPGSTPAPPRSRKPSWFQRCRIAGSRSNNWPCTPTPPPSARPCSTTAAQPHRPSGQRWSSGGPAR